MALQFKATSVPLFKSSGTPAMNAACCCDTPPECFCSVLKFAGDSADCGCLTEDFGTQLFDRGDATFDLSGTMTPFGNPCLPPSDCVDVSGSYVVPVDTTHWYVQAQYICTLQPGPFQSFRDYYHVTTIQLQHYCVGRFYRSLMFEDEIPSGFVHLICEITSSVRSVVTGSENPYPSLTGPLALPVFPSSWTTGGGTYFDGTRNRSFNSVKTWRWLESVSSFDDFLFVPDSTCTSECNTIIGRRACVSGAITPTAVNNYDSGLRSCGPSGVDIAVTIAAPVPA